NPRWRSTAPPGPSNGAAHSLQRGADGIRMSDDRNRSKPGCSPVRTFAYSSSELCSAMRGRYAFGVSEMQAANPHTRRAFQFLKIEPIGGPERPRGMNTATTEAPTGMRLG